MYLKIPYFQVAELPSNVYWRDPFFSLCQPKHLTEFTVIDVDCVDEYSNFIPGGHGHLSAKVWLIFSNFLPF